MEYRGENLAIVTMLAASGVVCVWLMSIALGGFDDFELPLAMLGAGLGAAAAGVLVAGWFGRPGLGGWVRAAIAALVATALGGALGAGVFQALDFLVNPVTGQFAAERPSVPLAAMLGGSLVIASLGSPIVGLPWLAMMTAVHLISRALRG